MILYVPPFDEILEVARGRGQGSRAPHLWRGLVGAWPFQQRGGANVYDLSGYGNHGSMGQADQSTKWTNTSRGKALDFDGTDDYVDVGDVPVLEPSDAISISAWVYVNGTTNRKDEVAVVRRVGPSNPWYSYVLKITANNSDLSPSFSVNVGGTLTDAHAAQNLSGSTWYHLLGTWSSGDTLKFYIDGVLDGESGTATGSINYTAGKHTYIAYDDEEPEYLGAVIADVRIYDRALAASEIEQIYSDPWAAYSRRPVITPGIVAPPAVEDHDNLLLLGVG